MMDSSITLPWLSKQDVENDVVTVGEKVVSLHTVSLLCENPLILRPSRVSSLKIESP